MRTNLPITNVEYILKDSETVVSKTDLHGNIIYVNASFVEISGYSESELIGAPQNIVRHPDMPPEAFEDFWGTIKSGKAWTGLVKNRCKNGDHYWVEANAAPMLENGQTIGYTSVRVKPTREQVAAAERAYRAIRSGSSGMQIREGTVVTRAFVHRFDWLTMLTIKSKITLSTGLLMLLFCMNLAVNARLGVHSDWWSVALACVGIVVSMLVGLLQYRTAVLPLEEVRRDIEKMSAGDLTGKINAHGGDELAQLVQSLRVLQTNMKLLVGQIKESTDAINVGAQESAAGKDRKSVV